MSETQTSQTESVKAPEGKAPEPPPVADVSSDLVANGAMDHVPHWVAKAASRLLVLSLMGAALSLIVTAWWMQASVRNTREILKNQREMYDAMVKNQKSILEKLEKR